MMKIYEKESHSIRPDSKISAKMATAMFMAKLESLAMTESSGDGDDGEDSTPVIFKPLCITVSRRTIIHLSNLIERTSSSYFDSDVAMKFCPGGVEDYVSEMYVLLAALRILKVDLTLLCFVSYAHVQMFVL